jgi:hypothetical protein
MYLGYWWPPTPCRATTRTSTALLLLLRGFLLSSLLRFFLRSHGELLQVLVRETGLNAPVLHLPAKKAGHRPAFCRLARTGMAHAHHRTAAKTARGAMQGERKRGYKGERSRITRQPQVARLRCAACRTSQSIQVSLCPFVVRRCITLSADYFVLVITDTALI